MAKPDMEVIKEIPGYKVILKAVLKSQIQQLVEQLASTTEEESVILTASVADGTLCHLGSDSGKVFLEDHEDIKSQFLGFCLKRHHKLKQEKERKEAQEREEALARSMQAVTPPRYDAMGGSYIRSPRYHSPQQSPHPIALSRAGPGSRMRSPGNRHQPYPMARPTRPPLNFDQQGRSPGQGPGLGPMGAPVRNTKIDGQVIKIEPEDDDEKSNQSANENTSVQSEVKTNVTESSQPSSPSNKPSTPSHTQGPSDNEDARSESSSSTIPNEASDLKLSDNVPAGGLSLDSDLSNILPTTSSVDEPSTSQGNEQGTIEGLDPNISVKLEAGGDSEMDLEITGVELGQSTLTQEQMSSQEWMASVQNVMQGGASGSSADMSGQQGYTCLYSDDRAASDQYTRPPAGVYDAKFASKNGMEELFPATGVYVHKDQLYTSLNKANISGTSLRGTVTSPLGGRDGKVTSPHGGRDGKRIARYLLSVLFTKEQLQRSSVTESEASLYSPLNQQIVEAIIAFSVYNSDTRRGDILKAMRSSLTSKRCKAKKKNIVTM